ncbi:MAG TPA: flavodoxin [Treponema sp.]|nr:flavodoxin [Treponema sp.]
MTKAIVYASTTGNTEMMAQAVEKGAKRSGADVLFITADKASAAEVLPADVIILGSPAMGAETLEDSMETFFSTLEGKLKGKKVALFGSYDWGDGQWMRDWADRVTNAGGKMINGQGLIGHLTPDESVLKQCEQIGESAA